MERFTAIYEKDSLQYEKDSLLYGKNLLFCEKRFINNCELITFLITNNSFKYYSQDNYKSINSIVTNTTIILQAYNFRSKMKMNVLRLVN